MTKIFMMLEVDLIQTCHHINIANLVSNQKNFAESVGFLEWLVDQYQVY